MEMTTLKSLHASFASSQGRIRKVMAQGKMTIASRVMLLISAVLLLAVVSVWLKGNSTNLMTAQTDAVKASNIQPVFRKVLIADGTTNDGFKVVSYLYKAADCVPISYDVTFFDTTGRAQSEMQKQIGTASQILQHGAEKDEKGNIVGERYVASFAGSDQAKPYSAIVLTRNSDFISITSSSLTHAQELEKVWKGPNNYSAFPGLESLSDVSFKNSNTTEGVTNEGVRFVREEFTSSDCEHLVTYASYFDSREKAEQELNEQLERAMEVSERGEKLNQAGTRVGTRAVAYFRADASSGYPEIAKIIWTEGAVLRSIEGAYTYVLEFESQQNGLLRR